MNLVRRPFPLLFAALACFLAAPVLHAETLPPIYVAKPIADITVSVGTTTSAVKLKKTFGLTGVTGDVVRFTTTLGDVDVQLFNDVAPATVANFLSYVNSGAYNSNFFHRSVSDFVLQGGGYSFVGTQVYSITQHDPVVNEFHISNTRGTLAMAKLSGDPNSATTQWFFNEADNAAKLDDQNGGFTVFGQVLGDGMNIIDAIGALNIINAGSPFDELPVLNTHVSGAAVTGNDLVYLSVKPIPLVPKATGDLGLLKLKVTANSNPGLVTPEIRGNKLFLTYAPGVTGSAIISIKGSTFVKGNKAKTSFTVTVQ